jgi:tRNA (guanine37-N1)-methyltransferase
MKYTVLTIFPEITDAYFSASIMARAVKAGFVEYRSINIRDFAFDKHKKTDDAPYGGGAGMLMLPEPLGLALEAAGVSKKTCPESMRQSSVRGVPGKKVIYLSPSGRPFTQKMAEELVQNGELILICGRYEGIDQRIIDLYVDEEVSIGDYVLSSGEAAALVLIDSTYRLLDRVINAESLREESFAGGLLEYPQYTRPEVYDTIKVPEELLSGHHENIRRWRLQKRLEKTFIMRPELIRRGEEAGLFDTETLKMIEEIRKHHERDQGN